MTREEIDSFNRPHDEINHSTFLHSYIKNADDLKRWGLTKLGLGLQTVEITEEMLDVCIHDALQKYTKYASFPIENIMVPLKGYDKNLGLDLSKYNISDILDISFKRDTLLNGFGNDMIFGWYGMLNSQSGNGIFPGFSGAGIGSTGWISLQALHEHFEMIGRMTGSNPQWRYFYTTKKLKITPTPKHTEGCEDVILLNCEVEPPPEELYGNEYVQRLFLAYLKIQVGTVRKKFASVQLLGGGQLDTSIGDEGKEELDKIMEQIRTDESASQMWYIA